MINAVKLLLAELEMSKLVSRLNTKMEKVVMMSIHYQARVSIERRKSKHEKYQIMYNGSKVHKLNGK